IAMPTEATGMPQRSARAICAATSVVASLGSVSAARVRRSPWAVSAIEFLQLFVEFGVVFVGHCGAAARLRRWRQSGVALPLPTAHDAENETETGQREQARHDVDRAKRALVRRHGERAGA